MFVLTGKMAKKIPYNSCGEHAIRGQVYFWSCYSAVLTLSRYCIIFKTIKRIVHPKKKILSLTHTQVFQTCMSFFPLYLALYVKNTRDATMPFFQIRSDPEKSEYRPIPIRYQRSFFFFFFFFFFNFVILLYFRVTLLCVKHNLLDNFIVMKRIYKSAATA